jgi:hypothetical protein
MILVGKQEPDQVAPRNRRGRGPADGRPSPR